ncbi:MAG: four helix bundle suffix domain-containing protein [Kiritimatiellae bacterium]|jgi:four helix bundle suffix protein|nr:four helix bundle suffix domain-containing protein [Kiritimatiellia bacterium]
MQNAFMPESLAANAALYLLNLACYLLDRQVESLAKDFENNGGFTEKLYNIRKNRRGDKW